MTNITTNVKTVSGEAEATSFEIDGAISTTNITVSGELTTETHTVSGAIETETLTIDGDITIGREYTGEYEFTPTLETQTIYIKGKTATQNITINPIPSNYGLITWNGSILTVS